MTDNLELLKKYKLKITPQRIAIVEELVQDGHLSIDDLYRRLLKRFPTISLATIYKNINAMEDNAFVQEVKLPEQKAKYELSKARHAHVVCNECKKVEDIVINTESIVNEVKDTSHYMIEREDLVFTGICPDCMQKKSV